MRTVAGAILIHAGCTLATAGGLTDDLALVPVLVGFVYLVWGSFSDFKSHRAEGDAS